MKFGLFSDFNLKIKFKPSVDNFVFRLHYRFTYVAFMAAVVLTTLYDVVGDKIKCIVSSSIPNFDKLVNSYCFIMGTFTVEKHHNSTLQVAPHQGVGPYEEGKDNIIVHSYYQWVPFYLFIMGVLFYLPHWQWKVMEGGLFTNIIQDLSLKDYLSKNLSSYKNRHSRFTKLSNYLISHMHNHRAWAMKFFACEMMNLVVSLVVLFSIDWFLDGEFMTYGIKVFEHIGQDPEDRGDPMSFVFPRIAKCNFNMFGPSGSIESRDVMCLIATNIINEKIFVFIWVWLVFLLTITSMWLVYRMLTILLPSLRFELLRLKAKQAKHSSIKLIMDTVCLSDWFLLCHLGKNMDSVVFSEFIECFAEQCAKGSQYKPKTKERLHLIEDSDL